MKLPIRFREDSLLSPDLLLRWDLRHPCTGEIPTEQQKWWFMAKNCDLWRKMVIYGEITMINGDLSFQLIPLFHVQLMEMLWLLITPWNNGHEIVMWKLQVATQDAAKRWNSLGIAMIIGLSFSARSRDVAPPTPEHPGHRKSWINLDNMSRACHTHSCCTSLSEEIQQCWTTLASLRIQDYQWAGNAICRLDTQWNSEPRRNSLVPHEPVLSVEASEQGAAQPNKKL